MTANSTFLRSVRRVLMLAAPMVGGMVSATVLTLIVIPAVYLLGKRRGLGEAVTRDSGGLSSVS